MKMPPKKYIIFAALIVVVAGMGIGAAVLFSQYQASIRQDNKKETKETIAQSKSPAEKTSDAAMKQAYEGDVRGGAESLDKAIESSSDSVEKYMLYSSKATLLYNNQDIPGALEAALKAYGFKKSSDSAALVGQFSRESGNTAQAIEYYKKAIQLIDKTDIYAQEDEKYYKNVISQLESGA